MAMPGTLYIVATPLGNLADLSPRAVQILGAVPLIAAEDTRHSATLLQHYGLHTPLLALHDHNERTQLPRLLRHLGSGQDLALISDAGTPLIHDPGYLLVRAALAQGHRVSPIPGPCALIAALSASGLPSDRFSFEGFLPRTAAARSQLLQSLRLEPRTLIFYETPHRISAALQDCLAAFGPQRPATLARELTKQFETLHHAPLGRLCAAFADLPEVEQRGEFVLLIGGADTDTRAAEARRVLETLLAELPVSQAVHLAERLTQAPHRWLYQQALAWQTAQAETTSSPDQAS